MDYAKNDLLHPYWISQDGNYYVQVFDNCDPTIPEKDRSIVKAYRMDIYKIKTGYELGRPMTTYCDERKIMLTLKKYRMKKTHLKFFLSQDFADGSPKE